MTDERTACRRRRAAIARGLARLRDGAGSAEDPRWRTLTWRSLERLPDWCALEAAARRERLTIAGAVALLPAVRRCLRGEVLLRLRELIGPSRLEALRRRPYRALSSEAELADAAALERQLVAHGVRVLLAEVDDPVARILLFEALDAADGTDGGEPIDDTEAEWTERTSAREIDPCAAAVAAELQRLPAAATTTVRIAAARGR